MLTRVFFKVYEVVNIIKRKTLNKLKTSKLKENDTGSIKILWARQLLLLWASKSESREQICQNLNHDQES
jgi:hypothetical protein